MVCLADKVVPGAVGLEGDRGEGSGFRDSSLGLSDEGFGFGVQVLGI